MSTSGLVVTQSKITAASKPARTPANPAGIGKNVRVIPITKPTNSPQTSVGKLTTQTIGERIVPIILITLNAIVLNKKPETVQKLRKKRTRRLLQSATR